MRSRLTLAAVVVTVGLIAFVALDRIGSNVAPGSPAVTASTSATTRARASDTPTPAPSRDPETGLRWVEATRLPPEAQRMLTLIDRGGPFRYDQDGAVFGNRERILPVRSRGYYREYTVVTPGEDDRGARRIVTGDRDRQFFYTGDHYASFVRVRR